MDHESKTTHECETPVVQERTVETRDRRLFCFMGKKKEEEVMAVEFQEKVKVEKCVVEEEDKEKEKEHGLLKKLHRSDSSSSSSSDEEEGEGEEKKKKEEKKEKKKEEEEKKHDDTTVPVEKCDEPGAPADEKKGFLDKVKDKLPGGHKKEKEKEKEKEWGGKTEEREHRICSFSFRGNCLCSGKCFD